MITAFRVSDLVSTAAEFRLADHLADGPKTSAELARLCGADADTLHRVMRALARIELDANGRTGAEFASLLDSAGFRLTRMVPTRVAQSVIEAVPR